MRRFITILQIGFVGAYNLWNRFSDASASGACGSALLLSDWVSSPGTGPFCLWGCCTSLAGSYSSERIRRGLSCQIVPQSRTNQRQFSIASGFASSASRSPAFVRDARSCKPSRTVCSVKVAVRMVMSLVTSRSRFPGQEEFLTRGQFNSYEKRSPLTPARHGVRRGYIDLSSPTRRTRSANRGSSRRGSRKGCTFRNCKIIDCS